MCLQGEKIIIKKAMEYHIGVDLFVKILKIIWGIKKGSFTFEKFYKNFTDDPWWLIRVVDTIGSNRKTNRSDRNPLEVVWLTLVPGWIPRIPASSARILLEFLVSDWAASSWAIIGVCQYICLKILRFDTTRFIIYLHEQNGINTSEWWL